MQASLFVALLALVPCAVVPAKVEVISAGWADGNFAKISIDGEVVLQSQGQYAVAGGGGIGINYVILDQYGSRKKQGKFNTFGSMFEGDKFVQMLQQTLKQDDFLVVAFGDEASNCIQNDKPSKALADLGATKSYTHLMYTSPEGKYLPFKCGQHGGGSDTFALPFAENKLTAFRNSYVFIVQKGGKVFAEEGKRPTTGNVQVSVDINFVITTTTMTTTTTNTELQALKLQLQALEDAARASENKVLANLTGLVTDLEQKLEDEVADRKQALAQAKAASDAQVQTATQALASEAKAREEAEQRVTNLENELADMKKVNQALSKDLTLGATNGAASSWGSDSTPTVEADGSMVTVKGSKVMFESENCGATDLCELHRTVLAIADKLKAVGNDD